MKKQELDVYSAATNAAIVRAPGRRFPGGGVQGDTHFSLFNSAQEVAGRVANAADEELTWVAATLQDQLGGLLTHYEAVMREHGLELPYYREG